MYGLITLKYPFFDIRRGDPPPPGPDLNPDLNNLVSDLAEAVDGQRQVLQDINKRLSALETVRTEVPGPGPENWPPPGNQGMPIYITGTPFPQ